MDRRAILQLVLVVLGGLLTPASALRAAERCNLKLTRPMVVAGIYLRATAYDYQWKVEGTHATVTFSRKGRAVATVQGETATFGKNVANNTLYVSKHSDSLFHIDALAFAHTNQGIVFPVIQSRPRHAHTNNPAEDLLMEDAWRNRPQPLPAVFK